MRTMQEVTELPAKPVDRLFDGPIDIIGDVHGELAALQTRRYSGEESRKRKAEM